MGSASLRPRRSWESKWKSRSAAQCFSTLPGSAFMDNGAWPPSALGSLSAALPCLRAGSETVLELREVAHRRLVEVARPQPGAALDSVLVALHADELPRTGESASAGASSLLGIGPGRWLLVEANAIPSGSRGPLEQLTLPFEIAIEIGDAWT